MDIPDLDEPPEERELDNFQLKVPQASGRPAAVIDQLQSSQAEKNLGIFTPPDGNCEPQFEAMRDRVDDWTTKMKAGCLPSRSAWLSYQCQLWSGLKYGIGTSPATLKELEEGLGTRDHKMLSMLGICRNINKPWRYLPHCFGGMGLHSLPVEATIGSVNAFLQHYGTETSMGFYIKYTLEDLQIELGVYKCPLLYNYKIWRDLTTNSWIKAL